MPAKFIKAMPRLPIANARRTAEFYTSVLGFKVTGRWPARAPNFLLLDRDDVRLAFDVVKGHPAQSAKSACGFYLETADVRALHKSISGRVQIEWGPEVYSYGRREFAIRDPDGYMIIFTEATNDPPTCVVD